MHVWIDTNVLYCLHNLQFWGTKGTHLGHCLHDWFAYICWAVIYMFWYNLQFGTQRVNLALTDLKCSHGPTWVMVYMFRLLTILGSHCMSWYVMSGVQRTARNKQDTIVVRLEYLHKWWECYIHKFHVTMLMVYLQLDIRQDGHIRLCEIW